MSKNFILFFVLIGFTLIKGKAQDLDTLNIAETEEANFQEISESDDNTQEISELNTISQGEEALSYTFPVFDPWNTVTVKGKLRMQGLPISPNLRVYMERGSLIDVSVSAPFVGEAVRIVINNDSVVAINKMNKTYFSEKIGQFLKYYPGGIGDVQSLLLAKFFIPMFDLSNCNIEELIEVIPEGGQLNVIPKGEAVMQGLKYGYIVDEEFNPLVVTVFPEKRPDIEIAAVYSYNLKGYNIRLYCEEGKNLREINLEMKEPEWNTEPPKEIELGKKYTKVGIDEFIKRIGR